MFTKVLVAVVATCLCMVVVTATYDRESSHMGFGNLQSRQRTLLKKKLSDEDTSNTACDSVREKFFLHTAQDNFAPVDKQVPWTGKGQRFFENDEFWGGPGLPIFVFIGGEGEESCNRLTSRMYVYDLAKEHHALMLDLEHRFYGESYPTADMSTENLRLLSSEQALADLARFLGWYVDERSAAHSKVIVVGGSYPGNLSGWFKLKYPHIAFGSIASSAPVTAKANFEEYMEVVANSIDFFDMTGECNNQIAEAAGHVAQLARDGQLATLDADFKTCAPMESMLDVSTFMSVVMGNVQGTVQYNNENSAMNVTNICATMDPAADGHVDAYTSFLTLNQQYMDMYGLECNDVSWNSTLAVLSAPKKDASNNMRPWVYQTCNEFGYFQTADSQKQPFYAFKDWLGMWYSKVMCAAAFDGWKALPETDVTNWTYGGVNIAGTNILFPSGTIDPWHSLGVTNSTPALSQESEKPVFILGTAHCADLYAPANSDPQSLTDARLVIANTVSEWLA